MNKKENNSLVNNNRKLSIKEFKDRKIILSSFPRSLFIELTRNCNLQCTMCRDDTTNYDPHRNMPFSLFKKIAHQLFPYAEYIDLRGYGESLILPDFDKFANYASNFAAQLKLITNFNIYNDRIIKYLAKKDFMIGVSFDGGSKKTFEKIRKNAKFETVLHNIKLFKTFSKRYKKKGLLYFQIVMQPANLNELPLILDIALKLNVDRIKLFSICKSPEDTRKLFYLKDSIKQIFNNISHLSRKNNQILELCSSVHKDLTIRDLTQKRCIHPWMYCSVDYAGRVSYCDHLIGESEKKYVFLGNLYETNFNRIWNNKKAQLARNAHNICSNGFIRIVEHCNWCYKRRYIDLENLFYPSYSRYVVSNQTRNQLYI